jgi:hypothetical protein
MSWLELILFWASYPNGTSSYVFLNRIPEGQIFLKRKSDYVKEPISKTDMEALWKVMIEIGDGCAMQWNPYGGKMSEISLFQTLKLHFHIEQATHSRSNIQLIGKRNGLRLPTGTKI